MKNNIFLVGPTASGKTTLGRRLAERLNREFLDSDDFIERYAGASVAEIFERDGEARFRKLETRAVAELTVRDNVVLATGAGAVLSEDNRKRLRKRGIVVHLRAGVRTQLARTANDRSRPLLGSGDCRERLEQLNRPREDGCRLIAHLTLDTDNKSVRELCDDLISALQELKADEDTNSEH